MHRSIALLWLAGLAAAHDPARGRLFLVEERAEKPHHRLAILAVPR